MNLKIKLPRGKATPDDLAKVDALDTSFLYEELRRQYSISGKTLDVDFRGMVSWVRGGDRLTHQVHPYPAKLLPQIAHFFCRASVLREGTGILLDPFCGSGTVALEASVAGVVPHVADANPFALMLSRVKTTPFDTSELAGWLSELRRLSARYRSAPEIEIVNSHLWYSAQTKSSLERILRAINAIADSEVREFFLVCFSVLARKLSFADPRVNVPVRQKIKESFSASSRSAIEARFAWLDNVCPFEEFRRVCEANIERVAVANGVAPSRARTEELGDDARHLGNVGGTKGRRLPDNSVSLVITSPPYGSAQKYVRASSLTLNWLGLANPGQLASLERRSIGREHLSETEQLSFEGIPEKNRPQIQRISRINTLRAKLTATYLSEMGSVVRELSRVTAANGRIVIVVGNNRVCGELVSNDEFLRERFEACGLTTELSLRDDIRGWGLLTTRNRAAPAMTHETIMVFRKGV